MTDLQQKYHSSPIRKSPASLDATILARAEQQATLNKQKAGNSWLPGWPPIAASAAVACLCLFLVFRPDFQSSAIYDTNSADSTSAITTTEAEKISRKMATAQRTPVQAQVSNEELATESQSPVATVDALPAPVAAVENATSMTSASSELPENRDGGAVQQNSKAVLDNKIRELAQTRLPEVTAADSAVTSDEVAVVVPETVSDSALESTEPSSLASSETASLVNSGTTSLVNSGTASLVSSVATSDTTVESAGDVAAGIAGNADSSAESTPANSGLSARSATTTADTTSVTITDLSSDSEQLAERLSNPIKNIVAITPDTRPTASTTLLEQADTGSPLADSITAQRQADELATTVWLDALPGYEFVLQLSIGRDRVAMENELRGTGIDMDNVYFLPVTLREDPGYASLYGPFATDTEAYNRAREIEQQGRFKPWVRTVSDFRK